MLWLPVYWMPPVGWWAAWLRAKTAGHEVRLYHEPTYQRQSLYNRAWLKGSHRVEALTMRVNRSRSRQAFGTVSLAADDGWARQSLTLLRSAYGRTPYYMYFEDELHLLWNQARTSGSLLAANLQAIDWLRNRMGFPTDQALGQAAELTLPGQLTVLTQCPGAQCRHREYKPLGWDPMPYPQMHPTIQAYWVPHLSALDLVLNLGPDSATWLQQSDAWKAPLPIYPATQTPTSRPIP